MQPGPLNGRIVAVFGVIAVLTAIATGVALRLEDPLSTTVIPAEDPYTHMALVRGHLQDGSLDALYDSGSLYPPGMHVFLAAAWVFTGGELTDIFRFGPVVFGAVGILGMAALLWRHVGPVAAFVGSMAYAVAPEIIFRTTMMSPTAMDLALIPFLFMGFLAMVSGRLGWVPATAAMSMFMAIAHPWLFGLIAPAAVLFLVYSLLFPVDKDEEAPVRPLGLAAAVAVLAGSMVVTLFTGPGLFRTIEAIPNQMLGMPLSTWVVALAVPVGVAPFVLYRFAPRMYARFTAWTARGRPSLLQRGIASAALAALLVAVTVPALQNGMPELVDLPRMFGWPILALAAAGFVALPFLARPLPVLAASFATITYPFVIYNPLNSPFWPHRTAAFLGVALMLLVGLAAAALTRAVAQTIHEFSTRRVTTPDMTSGRPTMLVAIPVLLLAPVLGGGVFAATPVSYDGWYRMYEECEMEAFEDLAAIAEAHPETVVVTGSYQAKLALAGSAPDAERVWLQPSFYNDPDRRDRNIGYFLKDDTPAFVVVDVHLLQETPDADTGFLQHDPWKVHGTYCEGVGGKAGARLTVYTLAENDPGVTT